MTAPIPDSNRNTSISPSRAQSKLAKLLSTNKWIQLLEIATVFSPVLIVLILFHMLKVENPILLITLIWIANIVMLVLIGLGVRARGVSWRTIGLPFRFPGYQDAGRTFLQSVLILVLAIAAFVFGTIVMANLVGIPEGADMTQYDYLRGNPLLLLLSLVGVYIVSSFGEEVVYRGFLITRLETLFGGARSGVIGAVILSSVVFGFAHYQWGAMGIGQTTCMGAALAISFLLTKRNLWPLVLAHAYMDSLLLIQLFVAR